MRQALELALEALELCNGAETVDGVVIYTNQEIAAIKEALAQPEQEPVAYINIEERKLEWAYKYMSWDTPTVVNLPKIPLYTTPPQRKEPEQEPVAWMDEDGDVLSASIVDGKGLRNIPLYTTPPQRPWVGLTDEERNDCLVSADPCEALAEPEARQLMEDVEAKLKDKNR